MKLTKIALFASLICLVSACAGPRYSGSKISIDTLNEKPEVVIIKDSDTREGFLIAIQQWLTKNNYTHSVAKDGSNHNLEKLTIEYVGFWKWDLAIYLNEAEIEAFYKGQRVGEVGYRAPNSLNTNKYSTAEDRINHMLDILFGQISSADATKSINTSQQKKKNNSRR